jgi:hypothetical protein
MSTPNTKVDVQKVRDTIDLNPDARRYFYARIDEGWFDWLWKNGFLETVKEMPEDPTKFSYRSPELTYLLKMGEKIPAKVVDFMLSFDVAATSNLETLDGFLWITTKLSAEELARIVPKIRDERWIQTIGIYHHWTFGYKEMLQKLFDAGDHENLVTLAEALLSVRPKDEVERNSFGSATNPFYLSDIHYSEVFEKLSEVSDESLDRGLACALGALEAVLRLSDKEDEVFEMGESIALFDVDFFNLEISSDRHSSLREDVRDLAAVTKILTTRAVRTLGESSESVREFYTRFFEKLPDARSIWRLRLYLWSLRPDVFKTELRDGFFRIFENENPWPVASPPEYERALKIAFGGMSPDDQRQYIDGIFERFGTGEQPRYGYDILSSILESLSEDDKARASEIYGRDLDAEYVPQPSIGPVFAGTVVPQVPPDAEEGFKKRVPEIAELLKTEWAPKTLYENYKKTDFLRPINAEGIARNLQESIKVRLWDYVAGAPSFFDRKNMDANYTYAYLRGVYDAVRADYSVAADIDWTPIVELGNAIVESGKAEPFASKGRDREQFDSWLSSWRDVHSALADVMHELFHDMDGRAVVDFDTHRDSLYGIMEYLLSFPSPEPADEQIETAMSKVKNPGEDEYLVSDPYSMAINTARGRAFEAFLQFVFHDSKKFPKDADSRLSDDVKTLYEGLLARENTRAIMSMFGHYLFFFYFRDVEWTRSLLPEIFSTDTEKADLYLAAWEGYLTSALYVELFDELQGEYSRAIATDSSSYPKRSYRSNLDEALATHVALAYLHFKEFTLTNPLYVAFWDKVNSKRHQDFVSFIGRSVISRDQPLEWLKEHPEVIPAKMLKFWDWALENVKDPKVFEAFGFWINTKVEVFEPAELVKRVRASLQKSNGQIDWEYGLMDALPVFAAISPRDTVEILRLYFMQMDTSIQARGFMHIDADLVEVFRTLFKNPETKEATHKLITDLLPIGGGVYWILKDAMAEAD